MQAVCICRASAWFEEHGLIEEALHHALAAGDLDLAARQMSAGLREVLNREDWPTLERWLRLLPEEMIQRNPMLLMVRVWLLELTWRLDLQAVVLQQVEELLDSGDGSASLSANELQILRGQILMLKAQLAFFTNQISPGDGALPAGIGAPASLLDICARRGDVIFGPVHAGQRRDKCSRNVATE